MLDEYEEEFKGRYSYQNKLMKCSIENQMNTILENKKLEEKQIRLENV